MILSMFLPVPMFAPPVHQVDGYRLPSNEARGGNDVPVVAGRMICSAGEGRLTAFDAATFRVRWRKASPGPNTDYTIALGAQVYVCGAGYDGSASSLSAFDPKTGQVRWSVANRAFSSAVACAGGSVYASLDEGKISALDSATGRVRWTVDKPVAPSEGSSRRYEALHTVSGPEGSTVISQGAERAFALDAKAGDLLWEREASFSTSPSPAVIGRTLALPRGTGVDGLQGVDFRTGDIRWVNPVADSGDGLCAFGGRFVTLGRGRARAVDPADGSTVWARVTGPTDVSGGGAFVRPIGQLVVIEGFERTFGVRPNGSVAWETSSRFSFGQPLWTDGTRTTTFGRTALFRYEAGPPPPLPRRGSARRLLAESLALRYAVLDERSIERLRKLGEDAFPAVLRAAMRASPALDLSDRSIKRTTHGDHRVALDLAYLVISLSTKSSKAALEKALNAAGPKAPVRQYLMSAYYRALAPTSRRPLRR